MGLVSSAAIIVLNSLIIPTILVLTIVLSILKLPSMPFSLYVETIVDPENVVLYLSTHA